MNAMAKAMGEVGLKDYFRDDFKIGTAIGGKLMQELPADYEQLITREFNAITMENDMRWERGHPRPGVRDWALADKFVDFGVRKDMYIVGHVLVWHSQTPKWVFEDTAGKPVSREALLKSMQQHTATVVGRHKDRIAAWDVVNESVDEGNGWRKSPWLNIIGEELAEKAFLLHQRSTPKPTCSTTTTTNTNPDKRAFIVDFVNKFKKRGIPIHGIGMQGHVGLNYPDIKEYEKSIEAYGAAGMRVHITELAAWDHIGAEISTNFAYSKKLDPYTKGLPHRGSVDAPLRRAFQTVPASRQNRAITFWGTGDAES
ncbi:MAG: endo-1,4-beta-xylanase [Cellvibrionaceae bacterium]|nr:endo-1,4-beta-xylanase [Cellvibrionaceae bacterium]